VLQVSKEASLSDKRYFKATTAAELDEEIRNIFAMELLRLGNEECKTLYVDYQNEDVKKASLIPQITAYGINVVWRKHAQSNSK
jgi:hypothetical protein